MNDAPTAVHTDLGLKMSAPQRRSWRRLMLPLLLAASALAFTGCYDEPYYGRGRGYSGVYASYGGPGPYYAGTATILMGRITARATDRDMDPPLSRCALRGAATTRIAGAGGIAAPMRGRGISGGAATSAVGSRCATTATCEAEFDRAGAQAGSKRRRSLNSDATPLIV